MIINLVMVITMMLAIAAFFKSRRVAPVAGVFLGGTILCMIVSPSILFSFSGAVGGGLEWFFKALTDGYQPRPGTDETDGPTPEPTPAPEVPTPSVEPEAPSEPPFDSSAMWEMLGWVAVAAVIVLVLAFLLPLAFGRAKHVQRKQAEAREAREALERKRAEDQKQWEALRTKTKDMGDRLMAYRQDLESLLKTPLIMDTRDPITATAYQSMATCRMLAEGECPTLDAYQQIGATDFAQAVNSFGSALERAERHAKAKGISHLPSEQRKAMKRAQKFWALASNSAASENERASALLRIKAEMDKANVQVFVDVPDEMARAIERGGGKMLALTR